ncbi:hypothetical protein IAT40_005345 [Kwoniella sp. CBS 6097]
MRGINEILKAACLTRFVAFTLALSPITDGLATSPPHTPVALTRRTISGADTGSPQFAGCISADSFSGLIHSSDSYGLVSSQVDEESCIALCTNKKKYSYSYYRKQSSECYCSHSNGPLPSQIDGGCDHDGRCTPCQGSVTYLDSPLVFEGCYTHLSGAPFLHLSDVEPHMDLELCLKICSTDVYDTEVVGFRAVQLDSRGKPRADPDMRPIRAENQAHSHDGNGNGNGNVGSGGGGGRDWNFDSNGMKVRDEMAGYDSRGRDRGEERPINADSQNQRQKQPRRQHQQQAQQKQRIGSEWATRWGWECGCYSGRKEGMGYQDHNRKSKCGKGDYWRYVVSPDRQTL